MWLKLNLDGIDFHFCISGYEKSTKELWDIQWCKVELALQSPNCIDYRIPSSEILLSCEAEGLRDNIKRLLQNEFQSEKKLDFIEPDLTFILTPETDTGHGITDVSADMHVHLWSDGLTANYISVCFGKAELESLLTYLRFVTGELSKKSDAVQELVEKDVLRIY